MTEKHQRVLIFILIVLDLIFVFLNTSTYDSGDSILHYLQSKQSFEHNRYFLDVWAKPVFILLSSPFAQFGFVGIKLFNTTCILLTIHLGYLIVKKSYPSYAFAIYVIGLFAVHVFLIQSSGLTEPLIGLFLAIGFYCIHCNKPYWAMLVISFTPLIRSEGFLFIGVFGMFGLLTKQFKSVLLLCTGTLVYSIIGYFYHHDILWLFHQNPYQGVEEKYGSGDALHFVKQLPYLLGWPVFMLLLVGLYSRFKSGVKNGLRNIELNFTVGWCFISLLVAHSIFWYFGLFHSFGLKRVLLAATPAMLILAFHGLMFCLRWRSKQMQNKVFAMLLLIVVVFPFSNNKAGFEVPDDFTLAPSQKLVQEATQWYHKHYPSKSIVSFGNFYFAETLQVDIDDTKECVLINGVRAKTIKPGSIVFWDNYFSVTDQEISQSDFPSTEYQKLKTFSNTTGDQIIAYIKLPPQNLSKD